MLRNSDDKISKYFQYNYGGAFKIGHYLMIMFAALLWFYYMFVFLEQLYLIANNLTFVESLSKVLAEKVYFFIYQNRNHGKDHQYVRIYHKFLGEDAGFAQLR